MKNRKLMTVLAVVVAAMLVLGGVSVASAKGGKGGGGNGAAKHATKQAKGAKKAASKAAKKAAKKAAARRRAGRRAVNAAVRKHITTRSLVRNLATLAGVSPAQINAGRAQGLSLSSIATSYSVEPTAVVDMTVAKLKTRLASLVASGHITQAKADAVLAKQTARLWRLMNAVPAVCPEPALPTSPTPDPAA